MANLVAKEKSQVFPKGWFIKNFCVSIRPVHSNRFPGDFPPILICLHMFCLPAPHAWEKGKEPFIIDQFLPMAGNLVIILDFRPDWFAVFSSDNGSIIILASYKWT